jgi:hypothetical protein
MPKGRSTERKEINEPLSLSHETFFRPIKSLRLSVDLGFFTGLRTDYDLLIDIN